MGLTRLPLNCAESIIRGQTPHTGQVPYTNQNPASHKEAGVFLNNRGQTPINRPRPRPQFTGGATNSKLKGSEINTKGKRDKYEFSRDDVGLSGVRNKKGLQRVKITK